MAVFRLRVLLAAIGSILLLPLSAATPEQVLIVVNRDSATSRSVGEYYARRRGVPSANICLIQTTPEETITREVFKSNVANPVMGCLKAGGKQERILYIVTTAGVPLRVAGTGGLKGDNASVDSELTLLYEGLRGIRHPTSGPLQNPFFGKTGSRFEHSEFPMYLVTRLAGFDFPDVKRMVDGCMEARNAGKFVIDLKSFDRTKGNDWLRDAAARLPKDRVILDQSARVLTGERDVIGLASWGSNDPKRTERRLGFRWLPGAITTEYVSTNGRTFRRPPESWNIRNSWESPKTFFAGSPQTLTADYLHDGASGASGHVFEPYLEFTPRPNLLLPAYYRGRNLAESYYLSIPALSWQNIVVGDPLCSLGPP